MPESLSNQVATVIYIGLDMKLNPQGFLVNIEAPPQVSLQLVSQTKGGGCGMLAPAELRVHGVGLTLTKLDRGEEDHLLALVYADCATSPVNAGLKLGGPTNFLLSFFTKDTLECDLV